MRQQQDFSNMATTAQDALTAFEKTWLTTDWTTMNATQKQTFVANHYGLRIAAAKEIDANNTAAQAQAAADAAALLATIKTKLTSWGFALDNSQSDWNKLYNHPKYLGTNWQAQATYQKSLTNSMAQADAVNYFCNMAYSLYQQYVQ